MRAGPTNPYLRRVESKAIQCEKEGHPLWATDNVVITPAGVPPVIQVRRMDLIVENVRRFRAGESQLNVGNKKAGYVVAQNE